jgi:hypothetical protein
MLSILPSVNNLSKLRAEVSLLLMIARHQALKLGLKTNLHKDSTFTHMG